MFIHLYYENYTNIRKLQLHVLVSFDKNIIAILTLLRMEKHITNLLQSQLSHMGYV